MTSASATASVPEALPTTTPEPPPPHRLKFVFDCEPFTPATPGVCPELQVQERALLVLANTYRVPPVPAWQPELADRADAALKQADGLDARKLGPIERAAWQNAAIELLAWSSKFDKDPRAHSAAARARALVKKFSLSRAEIGALPASSTVLPAWLGDGASWQRGLDSRFMHTTSDGFARAHQQLRRNDDLADVTRLVLASDSGTAYVSDVVQRVVVRRTTADSVRVCIAELDPLSGSCGTAGALRALDPARGQSVVTPPHSAPCSGCHTNNTPRATPYGPDTGFQLSDSSVARIKTSLKPLLQH
jgi:hypothetical protein